MPAPPLLTLMTILDKMQYLDRDINISDLIARETGQPFQSLHGFRKKVPFCKSGYT